MKQQYSLLNAAKWSSLGLAFAAAVGGAYVGLHESANHFETLHESFKHVAKPSFILPAIGLSLAFGGFMEFKNSYNRALDHERAINEKPDRPREPQ